MIEKYETKKEDQNPDEELKLKKQQSEQKEEEEKIKISVKDDVKCFGVEEREGMVWIKHIVGEKSIRNIDISIYGGLCMELKQLYTAITRPRNRLLIYDEKTEGQEMLLQYWSKLNLVQVVKQDVLEKPLNQLASNYDNDNMFKQILSSTSREEWKNQGLKMYKYRYYEQAMKCFEKSNDQELYYRSQASFFAEEATKQLVSIDSEINSIKERVGQYEKLTKKFRRIEIRNQKELEKSSIEQLKTAAGIFISLGLEKQAAQCYFSAGDYTESGRIYAKLQMYKQAGESYYLSEDFITAAGYFELTQDYIRIMECYDALGNYERILETISKYSEEIGAENKANFVNKYLPLALEELVVGLKIGEENQDEGQANNNNDQPIKEEDDESSDDDEEIQERKESKNIKQQQEQQIESVKQEQVEEKKEQQQIEEEKQIEDITLDMKNDTFEKIQQPEEQANETSIISKVTLSQLEQQSAKDDNNYSKLENYEHLDHIDFTDEWLQLQTNSPQKSNSASIILESLSQFRSAAKSEQSGQSQSLFSDYSALEFNQMLNPNTQLVKTQANIYIQDQSMQKIIKYISMFNDECKSSLNTLRSKGTLLSGNQTDDIQLDEGEFLIDLDQIQIETVFLILDILEAYKIYKLCIFVCNRYRIAERIGRYLVSIAHRYSSISQLTPKLDQLILDSNYHRQAEYEKAYIAHLALHHVLENIHPDYLKLKQQGEKLTLNNSLGIQCFQGLIFLGMWKKTIFMMDYSNSLAVAKTFADFNNYKLIFFTGNQKYQKLHNNQNDFNSINFQLVFNEPQNLLERDLNLLLLESVIWDYSKYFHAFMHKSSLIHSSYFITVFFIFIQYFEIKGEIIKISCIFQMQ